MNRLFNKVTGVAVTGAVLSLVGAGNAFAFSLTNDRTPQIVPKVTGEKPLQVGLNEVDADITVVGDQSETALWDVNSPFTEKTSAGSTILLEIAGFAGSNTFGLYDPVTKQRIEIFEGLDGAYEAAKITFTTNGSGGFTVNVTEAGSGEDVDGGTLTSGLFGFYLGVKGGPTFYYTDDTANIGINKARALVFEGNNDPLVLPGSAESFVDYDPTRFDAGTDWILAFEDNTDFDYNDFVVKVGGVGAAVPEPLTMLGAGAAASFGAFFKRQTARKQKKDN